MNNKSLLFFFFLLFFAISQSLSAATYYISPTGIGAGTLTAPMSFSSAIAKTVTGGDSLVLRGGFYSFNTKQSISKSGTSTSYLHFVNYPGESPILDFRTEPYNSSNPGVSLSGNYVHFKGITIQGAGDNGLYVSGSYNFIENCTFRWNSDSGLQLKTGSNNIIKNCDAYENFDYQTGGTSSPDYGGNADGFADKQYTNTGTNKYFGCRSWLNSDDGWDMYEKIGNAELDSCICYMNGPAEYDMTNHIRFKTDSAAWFSKFKNASGRYVIKNYGNGNGFKVGGNYTANNVILRNCVSTKNKVKGFDQNNNNGTMTLYNCTGHANNPDFGFSSSSYGSLVVKNCASLASVSSNKLASKTVTQSNNSWLSGFSCVASDFLSIDNTLLLQSRQTSGKLALNNYLRLSATSNLINKGVNVGLPFVGTAPDLGAYEYNPNTAVTTVSTGNYFSYNRNINSLQIFQSPEIVLISDLSGKIIYNDKPISNNIVIRTDSWKSGIYVIQIVSANGESFASKIIR